MMKKNNPTPVRLNEEFEQKIKDIITFQTEETMERISVSDVLKQGINELHKQMIAEQKERKKQKKLADLTSPKAIAFKQAVKQLFDKTGGIYLSGKGKHEVHLYQTEKGVYGCLRESKHPCEDLPRQLIFKKKTHSHLTKLTPDAPKDSSLVIVDNGIISNDFDKVLDWAILLLELDDSFCWFDVLRDEQIKWKMKLKASARELDEARSDKSISWQMNLDLIEILNELDYLLENGRLRPIVPDSTLKKYEVAAEYTNMKRKLNQLQTWATSEKANQLPSELLNLLLDK